MRPDYLDGGGGIPQPQSSAPDLSKTTSQAADAASSVSQSSYDVVIDNISLNLFKDYGFVFSYLLVNDDPKDTTLNYGPTSPRFIVTKEQVNGKIQDHTVTPSNVVTKNGLLSYQVTWDKPTFEDYVDTIIWEGTSSTFNGTEPVVWTGTGTQATILTSNTNVRYIKIMHRDKFKHAETTSIDKYFISGAITPNDPVVIDANPPVNDFTVGQATVQNDPDGLFTFNKKILFSWSANSDTSTYGYQIRFRISGTTDYTYMSVPGRTVTSTYLYGVKAGQTYEIQVSTYDQFGNTNTSDWKSYPNIVIPASTSLAADVAITAGDMKMGYGIGGNNANKGLYLGPENYWYIQGNTTASSAARLSVGGTGDKLVWDGTNLSVTGNLNARGGTFTGNILLSTANASIYNGSVNSSGTLVGNGFALNSSGLKIANGASSVTLNAADGTITANAGTIGGWSLSGNTLSQNNAELNSGGYVVFGSSTPSNMIKITSQDANYVMWAGNNNGANAPFSVSKTGALYATGATITGNVVITGGTTKDAITAAQNDATSAYSRAGTAISNAADAATAAQAAKDRADYVAANAMLETNINTVLAKNTTIIDGSRVTTGTIDVARLNIAGGAASSGNYFKIDGTSIQAYSGYNRTLYIASDGTAKIGGWNIGSSDLTSSSGGTLIKGDGKIYIGTDGSDALTLSEGSNIAMFASTASKSSINFYRSGLSGDYWDSQFSQTVGGNMSFQGNNYAGEFPYIMFIKTYNFEGVDIRSYTNAASLETIKVTRINSSASANTTDLGTTTQILQFYKGYPNNTPQTSWTTTAIGGITARNATTSPAFFTGSDERLKKNIEVYSVNNFIEDIKGINVYKYHDAMLSDDEDKSIGFLAKEFYPKYPDIIDGVPDAVDEYGDPEYMKITRENLIPHMFAAVKHLVLKVESLEERLNAI
jgi:hypothetical protein